MNGHERTLEALALLSATARERTDPDPVIERRLSRAHAWRNSTRRARLRLARAFAVLLLGTTVATAGIRAVRSWWVHVQVGDRTVHRETSGNGEERFEVRTDESEIITVRVRQVDEGTVLRQEILVDRKGPLREEAEHVARELGPRKRLVRHPASAVEGRTPLTVWIPEDGVERRLFLVSGPAGQSRILVHVASGEPLPVVELPATLPTPTSEVTVSFEGGRPGLSIHVEEDGVSSHVLWSGDLSGEGDATEPLPPTHLELTTPDGHVRVRTGEARE